MNFTSAKSRLIVYSLSLIFIILTEKIFHDILHEEGIHIVNYLQSSQRLINFFKIFAFLGSKIIKFYIFLFIICICNFHHAFIFVLLTYFSQFLCAILKIIYKDTRPFLEFNEILALDCETGYGFPSNHELTSIPSYLIFLDILFVRFGINKIKNEKLIYFIGHFLLFAFFISLGISRMVAGVHYLHQIIFGFALGYLNYFIFTDLLKINLDKNNQNEFVEAFYGKENIKKYILIYLIIYIFSLFLVYMID